MGAWRSVSAAGVRIVAGGPRSRWRDRMLRTTSAEWTPCAIASAQAASTEGSPSVSTADHLPIAILGAGELAPHALHRRRQHPILEGSAVAQGTGLAGEHRHVMPGVVDRVAAAERAGMLADDPPVLADRYEVSIRAAILKWLGITDKRAMIVVSKDGFIDWAWGSERLFKSGIFYRARQEMPLPELSLAA